MPVVIFFTAAAAQARQKKLWGRVRQREREKKEIKQHCALFYVEIFRSLSLIRGKGWVLNTEGNREKKGRTAGSPRRGLWGLPEVVVNLFPVTKLSHWGAKFKLLLSGEFFGFHYTERQCLCTCACECMCMSVIRSQAPPSSTYYTWCLQRALALCRADRLLCAKNKRKRPKLSSETFSITIMESVQKQNIPNLAERFMQ